MTVVHLEMDTEIKTTTTFHCSETNVVRWYPRGSSPDDVLKFLEHSGYETVAKVSSVPSVSKKKEQKHTSNGTAACLIVISPSESEAIRLCEDFSENVKKVNQVL